MTKERYTPAPAPPQKGRITLVSEISIEFADSAELLAKSHLLRNAMIQAGFVFENQDTLRGVVNGEPITVNLHTGKFVAGHGDATEQAGGQDG